ncbi:LysR substrate-binding domain-containing protein [Ruegeria arenilitoris]|uniref:LysR substrate-binding domain-containing protein n=1 Tax=Ruegeria arenilitoris TaxID=1173585 RepID=UPI001C2BEF23|nr:LysR substrate-binding domain-containing protein [Ruegeria arenilitoris]
MENLRHLRALQAFDETATHSSLTKAAGVLNVTHGAISRQIKLLELHLGVTLFHRRPNGVELTKAGERLHQSTRGAFSALQLGVMEVKRLHHRQSITVSLSTSLALKWLVPLLSSFQQEHPGIALLLDTNDAFADFDTSEVDVALRFGEPGWNGLYHEQIRQEELVVVAAPSLVENTQLPMRATDITDLPLLHDAFNIGWESWAAQVGLNADQIKSQSIKYVDSAVLLEAAIDGQGVALARHLLAARDLEFGRLIRLDESHVPLDRGLYFVCRPSDQDRVSVRIFKKWLLSI